MPLNLSPSQCFLILNDPYKNRLYTNALLESPIMRQGFLSPDTLSFLYNWITWFWYDIGQEPIMGWRAFKVLHSGRLWPYS
jgi:hypothetical protein